MPTLPAAPWPGALPLAGRRLPHPFPHQGSKCAAADQNPPHFPKRELQIDHRIPFEIGGESGGLSRGPEDHMLVRGSANRVKSWDCDHCSNWAEKNPETCRSRYWADPESHTHTAMKKAKRMDVMRLAEEVRGYDRMQAAAGGAGQEAHEYFTEVPRAHLPQSGS